MKTGNHALCRSYAGAAAGTIILALYFLAIGACGTDQANGGANHDPSPSPSIPTEATVLPHESEATFLASHPFRDDARALLIEDDTSRYGQSESDLFSVTLCEHVYYADGGAGFYRVVNATGVVEEDLDDPQARPRSMTYFELERLQDWGGGAPQNLTLRIGGGPRLDGGSSMLVVELEEGEEVGLLIKEAESDENAGFATTAPDWVWRRDAEGLYANEAGSLRLELEELARRIREVYEAFPDVDLANSMQCRVQVPWEQCPPDSLVPDDALRLDGEEGCDNGRWLPGYEPDSPDYGNEPDPPTDEPAVPGE